MIDTGPDDDVVAAMERVWAAGPVEKKIAVKITAAKTIKHWRDDNQPAILRTSYRVAAQSMWGRYAVWEDNKTDCPAGNFGIFT